MQNVLGMNKKEMCVDFVVNLNIEIYCSVQVKYRLSEGTREGKREREMSQIHRSSSLSIVVRKCL